MHTFSCIFLRLLTCCFNSLMSTQWSIWPLTTLLCTASLPWVIFSSTHLSALHTTSGTPQCLRRVDSRCKHKASPPSATPSLNSQAVSSRILLLSRLRMGKQVRITWSYSGYQSLCRNRLLTSGWWKYCRKPNYIADWTMSLTWGAIIGTASVIPYFYSMFFIVTLLHRCTRDFERYASFSLAAWFCLTFDMFVDARGSMARIGIDIVKL